MGVHQMRSRAEASLAEYFAQASAGLPGGAATAAARADAFGRFLELGLPGKRVEEWKYTDLRAHMTEAYAPLALGRAVGSGEADAIEAALGGLAEIAGARLVIVDGRYEPGLSRPDGAGDGLRVRALTQALAAGDGKSGKNAAKGGAAATLGGRDAIVALNGAFASDGVVVDVSGTARRTVQIVHVQRDGGAGAVTTRNIIRIADGADALVIESHVAIGAAPRQVNAMSEVEVGVGARLDHVKLQSEGEATTHLSTWAVELEREARYVASQLTRGGKLTRNQVYLRFGGEGAVAHLNGVMMQRASQHCDTTLVVDHEAGSCESRELFKAVLDGEARGIFQGKIIVRPEAQKTDGRQMTQALLLSETAEFDAKPELEIFADDVACGHGATSGQLDEEMLFYLRARGVPEVAAKALLIEAFAGEALDEIEEPDLREVLAALTRGWLAEGRA